MTHRSLDDLLDDTCDRYLDEQLAARWESDCDDGDCDERWGSVEEMDLS